ncbi:ubiquitin-like domain-containing CTD phosphatase 1 [Convolutriloba macropyga]|uniref:ubiquitin-like domain-containing CTD phosphatase 1 n=1 Tax=Convolutriloba macropyga TaxID=536237 RepID=UPI003F51B43F
MGDGLISIVIKWQGKEYELDGLEGSTSVEDVKKQLQDKTSVRCENQKLIGLKHKKAGTAVVDATVLSDLNLKKNAKIMMMGTVDEEIEKANQRPEDLPDVVDDFDIPTMDEMPTEQREEFLAKIERRVKEYKVEVFNPPEENKKLLVLDIDYTLFDHRSVAENGHELMRPYLHEFLEAAYQNYNIVIWSATGMKWITAKMEELGVKNNPNYKIVAFLDSLAMITVETKKYGLIETKPLGVIWGKYPHLFSEKNSLLIDDLKRNFLMSPKNGLKIRPFAKAHRNKDTDKELLNLIPFLQFLSMQEDFTKIDFDKWESYCSI